MTKTITIPEELRDKVQNADIEHSARRDIITNIISNGTIEPTNEFFQKYQDEYNKSYFAFEKAKTEVEKNYVKKIIAFLKAKFFGIKSQLPYNKNKGKIY